MRGRPPAVGPTHRAGHGVGAPHPTNPGLAEAPFLTNETVFGLDVLSPHLVVLGGGPIGVELAQAFRRLGSAVTLVASGPILPRDDPEAAALVRERLLAEGVTLCEHVAVTRVAGCTLHRADGVALDGSHLLVAAGRSPSVDALQLDRAGIAAGPDGIAVSARRRTSNHPVFAIGDCRAGPRSPTPPATKARWSWRRSASACPAPPATTGCRP